MRTFGGLMLAGGVVAFFWSSSELGKVEPVPAETPIATAITMPAGRLDVIRYAAATAAGVGMILSLFPKGQ